MDDFTSCYFCGTAVEAPVREHPVVPADLGGGDGPTVTLCPTCRRKHHKVLEAALSTLDAGPTGAPEAEANYGTGEAADPEPGAAGGSRTDEAADPDARTDASPDAGDDSGADPGGDAGADADDATSADASDGLEDPATFAGETEESLDTDATTDGQGNAEAVENDAGAGDDTDRTDDAGSGDGADDTGDDPAEDERIFTSSTPAGGGVSDLNPEESVGEHALKDDSDDADAPDVDLGSPPHSKVVRQLQNREFPVDREEIVTVASGAYGLSRDEANEALDALVAQGILHEVEEGRLDRGEG